MRQKSQRSNTCNFQNGQETLTKTPTLTFCDVLERPNATPVGEKSSFGHGLNALSALDNFFFEATPYLVEQ